MIQSTPPNQQAIPRAAAFAGLIFSLLMLITLGIIRVAIPEGLEEQNTVNARFGRAITLGLHLVPFAGLAFLWLIGVLRNRMGGGGRPVLCNSVSGERLALCGEPVCGDGRCRSGPRQLARTSWPAGQRGRLLFRAAAGLCLSEHLRRQDGGGFRLFDLRHRLAHRNPSTLDCVFGIRLRPDPSVCHLELDVDRDAVSPVDVIGEHLYSRSGEKLERR